MHRDSWFLFYLWLGISFVVLLILAMTVHEVNIASECELKGGVAVYQRGLMGDYVCVKRDSILY